MTNQVEVTTQSSREMGTVRIGRAVAGGIGVLFFGAYLNLALQMPQGSPGSPGPGSFPVVVGITAIGISLLLILEALFSPKSASGDMGFPRSKMLVRVLSFVGMSVGYIVLIPFLGQWIGSVVFITLAVKMLSTLPWWKSALIGVLSGVLISAFFIEVLGLMLPTGPLG